MQNMLQKCFVHNMLSIVGTDTNVSALMSVFVLISTLLYWDINALLRKELKAKENEAENVLSAQTCWLWILRLIWMLSRLSMWQQAGQIQHNLQSKRLRCLSSHTWVPVVMLSTFLRCKASVKNNLGKYFCTECLPIKRKLKNWFFHWMVPWRFSGSQVQVCLRKKKEKKKNKEGKQNDGQQLNPLVVRHLHSCVFFSHASWLLSQVIYESFWLSTSLSINVNTFIGHCFEIASDFSIFRSNLCLFLS